MNFTVFKLSIVECNQNAESFEPRPDPTESWKQRQEVLHSAIPRMRRKGHLISVLWLRFFGTAKFSNFESFLIDTYHHTTPVLSIQKIIRYLSFHRRYRIACITKMVFDSNMYRIALKKSTEKCKLRSLLTFATYRPRLHALSSHNPFRDKDYKKRQGSYTRRVCYY